MNDNKDKHYLTSVEIAKLMMVTTATVRQWAQKGKIPAHVTPGGHRRYHIKDVEAFAATMGINIYAQRQDRNPRILVVDDDSSMRNFVLDFLKAKMESATLDSAENGFVAGQKIIQFNPTVVIIDIMMPGISGIDVCKQIRENPATRNIKIIAVTGFNSAENISAVIAAGANVCLKKPLDLAQFSEALGIRDSKNPLTEQN